MLKFLTPSNQKDFSKRKRKKTPRVAQPEFLGLLFLENKYIILRQEIILESNEFKILCTQKKKENKKFELSDAFALTWPF